MPFVITHASSDNALAQRLLTDLSNIMPKNTSTVLVAVISPAATADSEVLAQINESVAAGRNIVPVLAADTPLPPAIAHLTALDFTNGAYPLKSLEAALMARPPALVRRTRREGVIAGGIAFFIFLVGLYAVGVLGIHAPQEEFDEVETARMDQRNTLIAPTLQPLIPVGEFAISQFDLTVTHIPTRLRLYLVQTVTATAQGTFIPTLTPRPSSTP